MSSTAPDPNRWTALAVCLVAGFMTLLDVSIVNVALPSIKTGLGAQGTARCDPGCSGSQPSWA